MFLNRINNSIRFTALILLITFITAYTAAAQELDSYIGQPALRLIETLGEPLLRSPHELWYSRETIIVGGQHGAPVVGGAGGISIGSSYEPLFISERPCNISTAIDGAGLIETIEQQGSGCMDFIYLLRRQNLTQP